MARDLYEKLNQQLIEELPKLIDLRVPYLDPCFEALIKCQLNFASAASQKLEGLKTHLPTGQFGPADGRVEAVLQQLRDLTIVGQPSLAAVGPGANGS